MNGCAAQPDAARAELVRRLVDGWPPLTADQRARLRILLARENRDAK